MSTERKLLTIRENEPALKGYRCFLAISDRVREERGEFFLQPHTTSVVWGGQRALFIFEHHSGEFGLYYDVQMQSPLADQSGGGTFETCTIVMKNKIFIPVPVVIQRRFVPESGEQKRLEIRCDILHINSASGINRPLDLFHKSAPDRARSLEIEARVPSGIPDSAVRNVTENSRILKFDTRGFEKE